MLRWRTVLRIVPCVRAESGELVVLFAWSDLRRDVKSYAIVLPCRIVSASGYILGSCER